MAKDDGFNQIGNLIAGRGERPFAPTEEWRSYVILIPKGIAGEDCEPQVFIVSRYPPLEIFQAITAAFEVNPDKLFPINQNYR